MSTTCVRFSSALTFFECTHTTIWQQLYSQWEARDFLCLYLSAFPLVPGPGHVTRIVAISALFLLHQHQSLCEQQTVRGIKFVFVLDKKNQVQNKHSFEVRAHNDTHCVTKINSSLTIINSNFFSHKEKTLLSCSSVNFKRHFRVILLRSN